MSVDSSTKPWRFGVVVVISVAIVGYFVGLQSPMNPAQRTATPTRAPAIVAAPANHSSGAPIIPSPLYSDLPKLEWGPTATWTTSLQTLRQPPPQLDETKLITITADQKELALAMRKTNRAFNGAPPTIPHPMDQMSAVACLACHETGFHSESLRISKMSHPFYSNCTQCHIESNPQHQTPNVFRESTFVGLPAPSGGPRAYPDAPPQVPHSTWMRTDCLSCHGINGHPGLQTTHPWRQNCNQCHTPAASSEQFPLPREPEFLSPLPLTSPTDEELGS